MSKECRVCHAVKPIEEFYDHPHTRDRKLPVCEACARQRQRRNGEARYMRNKLAGICVFCGRNKARPTCPRCTWCSARKAEAHRRRMAGEPPLPRAKSPLGLPGIDHYAERRVG